MSTEPDLAAVRDALSEDRLSPYLEATGNDLSKALTLYRWNARVSGDLFELVGHVEVILRNRLDEQLTEWSLRRKGHRSRWFDSDAMRGILRHKQVEKMDAAVNDAGDPPTPHGKVIAEFKFGFWRYLLDVDYLDHLWNPALHRAFPGLTRSDPRANLLEAARLVEIVYRLRNRIAHHESIHLRNLEADYATCMALVKVMDPPMVTWTAKATAHVRDTIKAKP